jgi:hypothetical protein
MVISQMPSEETVIVFCAVLTEPAACTAVISSRKHSMVMKSRRTAAPPCEKSTVILPCEILKSKGTIKGENCQNTAETAGYALRCVCYAVYTATKNAMAAYPGLPVVFSGGVASNGMLREKIAPLNPVFAKPEFSTDNAMGVAVLAYRMMEG